MEKNPTKKLPSDYTAFPGKLDHASCVCLRVGRVSTQSREKEIAKYVIPMARADTGIPITERARDKEGFSGTFLSPFPLIPPCFSSGSAPFPSLEQGIFRPGLLHGF